jgi:hypothetical protein
MVPCFGIVTFIASFSSIAIAVVGEIKVIPVATCPIVPYLFTGCASFNSTATSVFNASYTCDCTVIQASTYCFLNFAIKTLDFNTATIEFEFVVPIETVAVSFPCSHRIKVTFGATVHPVTVIIA